MEPVEVSPAVLAQARGLFPPGGSVDGRPSFEMWRDGPLEAVRQLFGSIFDELPDDTDLPGVKYWQTIRTPFFEPMGFFAIRDTNGQIEIYGFFEETGYSALVDDDPE